MAGSESCVTYFETGSGLSREEGAFHQFGSCMSNRALGQLDDRGVSSTRRDFSLLIGVSVLRAQTSNSFDNLRSLDTLKSAGFWFNAMPVILRVANQLGVWQTASQCSWFDAREFLIRKNRDCGSLDREIEPAAQL